MSISKLTVMLEEAKAYAKEQGISLSYSAIQYGEHSISSSTGVCMPERDNEPQHHQFLDLLREQLVNASAALPGCERYSWRVPQEGHSDEHQPGNRIADEAVIALLANIVTTWSNVNHKHQLVSDRN